MEFVTKLTTFLILFVLAEGSVYSQSSRGVAGGTRDNCKLEDEISPTELIRHINEFNRVTILNTTYAQKLSWTQVYSTFLPKIEYTTTGSSPNLKLVLDIVGGPKKCLEMLKAEKGTGDPKTMHFKIKRNSKYEDLLVCFDKEINKFQCGVEGESHETDGYKGHCYNADRHTEKNKDVGTWRIESFRTNDPKFVKELKARIENIIRIDEDPIEFGLAVSTNSQVEYMEFVREPGGTCSDKRFVAMRGLTQLYPFDEYSADLQWGLETSGISGCQPDVFFEGADNANFVTQTGKIRGDYFNSKLQFLNSSLTGAKIKELSGYDKSQCDSISTGLANFQSQTALPDNEYLRSWLRDLRQTSEYVDIVGSEMVKLAQEAKNHANPNHSTHDTQKAVEKRGKIRSLSDELKGLEGLIGPKSKYIQLLNSNSIYAADTAKTYFRIMEKISFYKISNSTSYMDDLANAEGLIESQINEAIESEFQNCSRVIEARNCNLRFKTNETNQRIEYLTNLISSMIDDIQENTELSDDQRGELMGKLEDSSEGYSSRGESELMSDYPTPGATLEDLPKEIEFLKARKGKVDAILTVIQAAPYNCDNRDISTFNDQSAYRAIRNSINTEIATMVAENEEAEEEEEEGDPELDNLYKMYRRMAMIQAIGNLRGGGGNNNGLVNYNTGGAGWGSGVPQLSIANELWASPMFRYNQNFFNPFANDPTYDMFMRGPASFAQNGNPWYQGFDWRTGMNMFYTPNQNMWGQNWNQPNFNLYNQSNPNDLWNGSAITGVSEGFNFMNALGGLDG
jgi:hypothetical protein